MGQISSKLRNWSGPGETGVSYWCQGCQESHSIPVTGPRAWSWDGNAEAPTFSPSVLVTRPANPEASEEFKEYRSALRCHTFVRNGMVEFLTDCTHSLAGQTQPLPDLPDYMRDSPGEVA